MRKLLTKLFLITVLVAFISATPCSEKQETKCAGITRIDRIENIAKEETTDNFDIHPLSILNNRFN